MEDKNATLRTEGEGGREREIMRRFCQKGREEKPTTQTALAIQSFSKRELLVWRTLQDRFGMRMRRQDVLASCS